MKPGVFFEKNYFLISDWNALISFATSPLKSNRQIIAIPDGRLEIFPIYHSFLKRKKEQCGEQHCSFLYCVNFLYYTLKG